MFNPDLTPGSLGLGVYADLAREVEDLGHRFTMLTIGSQSTQPDRRGELRALAASPMWQTVGAAAAPLVRTRGLLPAAAGLATYLRREGRSIDLLHVESAYPYGAAAALAIRASGWLGPLVVTPMGEDTLVLEWARYGFRRHLVPRRLVDWTLRRAACVRCISPMLEARIADLAPDTPRRVVPLNVSAEASAAAAESTTTRAERRRVARRALDSEYRTGGRPTVIALGRLHPFKGIETLVKAMSVIGNAMLLIAGPSLRVGPLGDTATRLLALAREIGVGDRVRWVGPVPPARALDVLAAADVVAVPSHLESLNKVCVEAAGVGTPFVVTTTTGISAWVPDDGVGIVVPPDDPRALGEALTTVIDGRWSPDPSRLAAFVRPFSPSAVASGVAAIYQSVLAEWPSGRGREPLAGSSP